MISIANVDGLITPSDQAKISILDRGFLYGDSIYEVFRTYQGVPYLYKEHMDRLENSARLAQLRIQQSREFLDTELKRTVKDCHLNPGEDIYVRLTITRGAGPIDLNPAKSVKTSYVILVKEVPPWNTKFYSEGVKLAIPQIRRNSIYTLEPNIKGGNYLNNVLAVGEATQLGADDALMCNLDGYISEASNSNIFFVLDGVVVTPDLSSGNLNGTTKGVLITLCAENRIPFEHRQIREADIQSASECFIASATREVMPVRNLRLSSGSNLEYPVGGGRITNQLRELYRQYIQRYVERHRSEAIF